MASPVEIHRTAHAALGVRGPRLRARIAARIALLVGAALAWTGCRSTVRALPWEARIADGALRSNVQVLVATIHQSSCAGPALWSLAYAPDAPPNTLPPSLGAGTYAFEIVGRDSRCVEVARGCTTVTLPVADGSRVLVQVGASSGLPACERTACHDGLCNATADAGAADGGA